MGAPLCFLISAIAFALLFAFQTLRLYHANRHYKRIKEYKQNMLIYYERKISENNGRAEILKRNNLEQSDDYINGERYHQILKARLDANEQIPL